MRVNSSELLDSNLDPLAVILFDRLEGKLLN